MFLKARKIDLNALKAQYRKAGSDAQSNSGSETFSKKEEATKKALAVAKAYTETGITNELASDALQMLLEYRYTLTSEMRVTNNVVGDYCTVLFFVLGHAKFESCPPKRLYAKIYDLMSKCVEGDGFLNIGEEGDAEKLQWVMEALYKTAEISEYYTEECTRQYMDCVDGCVSLVFGIMTTPTEHYNDLGVGDCSDLWLTDEYKSVTVDYVNSVEPRLAGLLKSVSYIRYALGNVDRQRKKVTLPQKIEGAVLSWLVSNFNEVDHDQFTTNMYNMYLENDVLPGEAFYYNKITHFIPNSPREILEKVRPQAFQDVLRFISGDVNTMFVLGTEQKRKNSALVENRTFSKAREAALFTAAISAISRDCGVAIRNSLVSYSKFECYSKEKLTSRIKYPALFSLGSFYILSTENEESPQQSEPSPVLYCADALSAIGLLVARLSNDGNQRAKLLCRHWGFV